jgi:hypothetical protein
MGLTDKQLKALQLVGVTRQHVQNMKLRAKSLLDDLDFLSAALPELKDKTLNEKQTELSFNLEGVYGQLVSFDSLLDKKAAQLQKPKEKPYGGNTGA